jgi:hypothetical protein
MAEPTLLVSTIPVGRVEWIAKSLLAYMLCEMWNTGIITIDLFVDACFIFFIIFIDASESLSLVELHYQTYLIELELYQQGYIYIVYLFYTYAGSMWLLHTAQTMPLGPCPSTRQTRSNISPYLFSLASPTSHFPQLP